MASSPRLFSSASATRIFACYYAYQQQYPYPYMQPQAYDPQAYGGAYYAYPQYYQPGNPGFPQQLHPVSRGDAEALAEASAAAAADTAHYYPAPDTAPGEVYYPPPAPDTPGEPEHGTPKLKPRADTFDGPPL